MTSSLNRQGKSGFELTVTIPWEDVKKIYDSVFAELASEVEIEGFRKGKAPQEMIAAKIDKSKVYGEVVNRILPPAYQKALEEHNLHPIISPQIKIASGEEEKDWQFIIKSAEKPKVDLDSYRQAVAAINAKGKIWTPGQGEEPTSSQQPNKDEEEKKQKRISEIIDKVLESCIVELPELMLDSEVSRLVTQLVEDVRNAGLTFEQYLSSSGQTADQIRQKYHKQAETALKLEFILEAIADDLGVQISQAEVDAVIAKESDPEKKKALSEQSYLIASILRRENTITRLLTL